MGYFRHHAIIVTSCLDETIEAAHAEALERFKATSARVTEITPSVTNGYRSFMVAPDGSKEGWGTSDEGDEARDGFVAWLRKARSYSSFVEVAFGGDEPDMVGVRAAYGELSGRADDEDGEQGG